MQPIEESPLLVALTASQVSRFVAAGQEVRHVDGEVIVREGTPGDAFYLILSGRVRISVGGGGALTVLSGDGTLHAQYEGDFFGEMSILDHEMRSATVTAEGEVLLFRVGKEELFGLFGEDPDFQIVFLMNLSRILSRRLRLAAKRMAGRD
jgi:cAMP-dependent protein kinase regulator